MYFSVIFILRIACGNSGSSSSTLPISWYSTAFLSFYLISDAIVAQRFTTSLESCNSFRSQVERYFNLPTIPNNSGYRP